MLQATALRDVACNTDPPPSFPREESESEDDTDEDEGLEDPPFEEPDVVSPPVSADDDKTFKDVITFLRAHHSLGPMKAVASKV